MPPLGRRVLSEEFLEGRHTPSSEIDLWHSAFDLNAYGRNLLDPIAAWRITTP